LAVVASNVADGEFHWRGHTTTLAAQPGVFWFLIVMNSILFAALLFWSISGRGFGNGDNKNNAEP